MQNIQVVPVFDGKNYSVWVIKMRAILKSRGLWKVVTEGIPQSPKLTTPTQDEKKRMTDWEELEMKDQTALQLLFSAVSEEIFSSLLSVTETSRDA